MTKREFQKHLTALSNPKTKRLDVAKLKALPLETRRGMGMHVIRHRGPVLVDMTEGMDPAWLAGMGYHHTTTSRTCPEYTFRHTSETKIR